MYTDITLRLPEDLVQKAQNAGILTDTNIAGFLKSELDSYLRRKALIFYTQREPQSVPPFTTDEIEAEIEIFRREQAMRRSQGM